MTSYEQDETFAVEWEDITVLDAIGSVRESRFPTPFEETIERVVDLFGRERLVLVGGLAVRLRTGSGRTRDVNFVVLGLDVGEAKETIGREKDMTIQETISGEFEETVRVDLKEHMPVDFLFFNHPSFIDDVTERADTLQINDISLPVATSEDLIIMKWIADREKDEDPIRTLLGYKRDKLDRQYINMWISRIRVNGEYLVKRFIPFLRARANNFESEWANDWLEQIQN